MLLRVTALALLALSCLPPCTLAAQEASPPTTQIDTDKVDARVFAIFFSRENAYLKPAKAADSPDKPEAQLPLPDLYRLDATQAASPEPFAGAWAADVATKV